MKAGYPRVASGARKATIFVFKPADGDLVFRSFFGTAGADDETPGTTVREILATVGESSPSDSWDFGTSLTRTGDRIVSWAALG
ncbi:hypothetical protein [Streptomyces sp. NPDC048392]|uniref:hypothetical protein n=1 Tax=Streptomyces sp. NPDC048392 TaxID=3365543 RepID=UPI00371349CB